MIQLILEQLVLKVVERSTSDPTDNVLTLYDLGVNNSDNAKNIFVMLGPIFKIRKNLVDMKELVLQATTI